MARSGQAVSTLGYDRMFVVVSAWLLGGLLFDGGAHLNLRSLETFFTP